MPCEKCGGSVVRGPFYHWSDAGARGCGFYDERRKGEHLHWYCSCGWNWTTPLAVLAEAEGTKPGPSKVETYLSCGGRIENLNCCRDCGGSLSVSCHCAPDIPAPEKKERTAEGLLEGVSWWIGRGVEDGHRQERKADLDRALALIRAERERRERGWRRVEDVRLDIERYASNRRQHVKDGLTSALDEWINGLRGLGRP